MKIVVSRDNEVLQEIDLGEEASQTDGSGALSFFIGRSEDCHVCLDDPKVSREHAELQYEQGLWTIKQSSSFGLLVVNGSAVQEKELAPGDMLILGPFVLTFFPAAIKNSVQNEPSVDEEDKETEVADMVPVDEAATQTVMDEAHGPSEEAQEDVEQENDASSDSPEDDPEGESAQEESGSEFDEATGFTSAGAESVEFSAENNDTAFPEDDEADVDGLDGSGAGFDMQADMNTDMLDDDGGFDDDGFDDDESTRVVQSFAKFELDLFGEYAPYDKFNLDQPEVLIGRDPEKCHIVLNDPEVSSVHASIKKNNITCTIEDLQSGNGTLLNGERVNKTPLTNGDEFIIGSTTFTVKIISDFIEEESDRLMPVDDNQVVEVEEVVEVGEDFEDDGENPVLEGGESFGGDSTPQGKQSLVQKFRSLPPKKQAIYGGVAVLLILLLLDDGSSVKEEQEENKEKNKIAKQEDQGKVEKEETALDPETLELVESSYQLANNYIQKGMYDEALQELDKNIFRYTEKYKNADQLRAIAVAGIEKREQIEAERRKEVREAQRRKKVKDLVARAQEAVEKKKVILAEELFGKIATLDPENFELSAMKIELDAWKKEQERKALEKAQREAERKRMVEELKPGKNLYLRKEWHNAIIRLEQFLEKDDMDDDLIADATKMLEESKKNLNDIVGPLLGRARSLREGQDLKGAYEHYSQVLDHEPSNAEAMNEMNEIRETLRLRSRKVYREAIIAESLSLLKDAKEKYKEVQQISPTDSEYYMKATDKLKEYQ